MSDLITVGHNHHISQMEVLPLEHKQFIKVQIIDVEVHTNHLLLLGDEQNICSLVNLGFVLLLFSGFERVVCFSNFIQVVCFQGFKETASECNCFAIDDCSDAIHMKNSYGHQGK